MTAGLVTQKNYMFSSVTMAVVHVILLLLLALTVYGYRLLLWRERRAPLTPLRASGRRGIVR
jgi:hypothetical protein